MNLQDSFFYRLEDTLAQTRLFHLRTGLSTSINQQIVLTRFTTVRSNHANRPIRLHSIVSHRIGETNGVVQVIVDSLNLGDAGATHVGNRTEV